MFVVLILLVGVVIAYLVLKGAIQTRRGRLVVLGRPLRSRLNKLAGRGFVLSLSSIPPSNSRRPRASLHRLGSNSWPKAVKRAKS